jgi:hypothetical protein
VYLFEVFTELARPSWMAVAAVEREIRVAMVSARRMSAGVVDTAAADAGRSRCAG